MSKEKNTAKEESTVKLKVKETVRGYETSDGTQFLLINDAMNHARTLSGDFVEPKEVELELEK